MALSVFFAVHFFFFSPFGTILEAFSDRRSKEDPIPFF
jgi:hypothetical protein